MSRARNRHDVVALRQHPRQCELGRGAFVLRGDLLDLSDELEILPEILTLKARVLSPEVIGGEIFDTLDLPGEKPAAKRAVGDEADAEHPERVEQAVFGVAGPE